jgi:predicted TIM-barrel fold metal-dependent hydrolase
MISASSAAASRTDRLKELLGLAPVIPVITIKRVEDAVPLARALVSGGLRQRDEDSLDVWRSGMRALAACPNVAVKVSELGFADRAWSESDNLGIIRETIEILGPSRALFASNFPVARMRVNYHRWVAAVESALEGFASDDRVAVFAGNAMRIYRIETNESTA